MKPLSFLVPALLAVAACGGGGDDGGDDTVDPPDASNAEAVEEVTCPATPAAEITTVGSAYSPMSVTIAPGEIVRFTPTATHDVNGELFDVPLGGEGCFQFNTAGTYSFRCTPHGFTGSVVVE